MSEINLKRNILMSGSFRIIIMALTFLTSWVSTRYLGVELKGKYSYLFTLSGFIWMTLDLGLYRSFPYLVRKHPDKTRSLFVWSLVQFIINTGLLIVLGLGFLNVWSRIIGYTFDPLYLVLFVGIITLSQFSMQLQSLYLGMNLIWKHSLAQLYNSLLVLIIVTIGYFFINKTDRLAYIIITMLLASAFSILYFVANNKWGRIWDKIDFRFIFTSYKSGFRVFLSTLFIILLVRFDIIIIKKMLGFSQVGIYSIAAHIVDLLQVASNLVGGLLLVRLSDSSSDIEKWKIMKKMLMAFCAMLIIANVGFIICGKFILATMFGIQFVPVYYVYLWLIPASFGLSFGSLFNMYLNSKGFPIISIILPAISVVVNVALNLILIPVIGIYGSALATSIAYVLWFVMIIAYEQKCTKNQMLKHLIPAKDDWIALWKESRKILSDCRLHLNKFLKRA
jgi:O-antigen/teichoic acid export membrane protein